MDSNLIPLAGIRLYPFLENIMPIITANAADWGIAPAAVDALQADIAPFMRAWPVFITPNSGKVDRDNMTAALKTARQSMAAFARAYLLYNPLVSAAIQAQMGFSSKPKSLPGWHSPPILWVDSAIRQVSVRFKGTESGRQGKAAGAHHLELCIKYTEDKPLDVDDYTRMETATKSPLIITCNEDQRRTRLWFWARWATNANERGIWSEMYPVYFT
ncbi:hypothetical protein FACS189461_0740 [Spirochaetia bacterium]|nr:hypothetical protein FACS189461_0740 [Spirochaetia bacterium]